MSLIADLLIVFILAFAVWCGYRKGIIRGVIRTACIILAFIFAGILAGTFSSDFTPALRPFVGGMIDSAYSSASTDYEAGITDGDYSEIDMGEDQDTYVLTCETLTGLGFSQKAANKLFEDNSIDILSSDNIRSTLSDIVCSRVAYVVVYMIAFTMLMIIVTVVGNIINISFNLPGIEVVNDLIGAAAGAFEGIAVIMLIGWFMNYIGAVIPNSLMNGTTLLRSLVERGPFIGML